jgi:hypothetical protein
VSRPIAASVTIAGIITFNVWAYEDDMAANATVSVIVERLDETGTIISTVADKTFGTELGTSNAAKNWTASAAEVTDTTFDIGDRIRVRVYFDDATSLTMGSGHTCVLRYAGTSAAFDGDSYVTFTETLTFQETDPTGSQLFLTDTASAIADQGAGVNEKEMWTTRGGGVTTGIRDTAAGFTAPLQWTTSAGGNTIEWYTKPLQAFTLSGLVKCNLRALESAIAANAGMNAELAVVNGDGSGAAVFASGGIIAGATTFATGSGELAAAETAETVYLAGQSISVTAGQRLRLRVLLDDSAEALVTANTATLYYAGTSGGASGDSYITLAQTVSEAITFVPQIIMLHDGA